MAAKAAVGVLKNSGGWNDKNAREFFLQSNRGARQKGGFYDGDFTLANQGQYGANNAVVPAARRGWCGHGDKDDVALANGDGISVMQQLA